jgi:signal transduction histidine kinase
VRNLLLEVARATAIRAQAREIRVDVTAPEELVALLDASLARRMLENLLANALRHAAGGGRVELAAGAERDRLCLAVRNTGEPVPPAARSRLFQKYATLGKDHAQRSGLGLYLCRLVAEAHGGSIALVEREGWNVSFEAELPLAPPRGSGAGGDAPGEETDPESMDTRVARRHRDGEECTR